MQVLKSYWGHLECIDLDWLIKNQNITAGHKCVFEHVAVRTTCIYHENPSSRLNSIDRGGSRHTEMAFPRLEEGPFLVTDSVNPLTTSAAFSGAASTAVVLVSEFVRHSHASLARQ
jgi:hypothetical protein